MRSLIAFVVLALSACGNVAADSNAGAAGGAAGDVIGAMGGTNVGGAGGQLQAAGGSNAGGAGGRLEATGGTNAGGRGEEGSGEGGHVEGGRGGAGTGGAGGAAAMGGTAGGVLTAPACKGNFIGSKQPECPRIADPKNPTNPNAGWQCEVGCSDVATENAAGCVYSGVSYCVSSCSDCHL